MTNFYYADGKKIPLSPSSQFMAVQVNSQDNHQSLGSNQIANLISNATNSSEVFELPQYNLAVVKIDNNHSTSVGENVRSFVNSQTELNLGPQVYEVAESSAQENLIPVGEILVKFKPQVSASEKSQLFTENNLQVEQRRAE